jgi:antitoxin (DNA-binding transcriptional repressor) of toxin-antitoxin stability system
VNLVQTRGHIIAKAGKPLVKVIALAVPAAGQSKRLGFLKGQGIIADDFDTMASGEIDAMFDGKA